ncbi:hypothetical protein EL17_23255 [Anditalea andensis]|uniref:Uncharacterized protein n=1 Tax=Anditalea andensis TaxID=1048983 RepID=A0A074KVS1_9BACT|nr:hypothetical protein EL17_23255 [Anditalea andensis]
MEIQAIKSRLALSQVRYQYGFKPDFRDHLFVHEYGHYLQSQRMGPLYLPFGTMPGQPYFGPGLPQINPHNNNFITLL